MTATLEAPVKGAVTRDEYRVIKMVDLRESKLNPRLTFDADSLDELTRSIEQKGVLEPILVRPWSESRYEIVAGARRFRAALKAKLTEIPAIVKRLTDAEALEVMVVENQHRDDVHPMEEAQGYTALLKTGDYVGDGGVERLAVKIGLSRSYVYQRLQLLKLIPAAVKAFLAGQFAASHAVLLARLPAAAQRIAFEQELFEDRWQNGHTTKHVISVREFAEWINREIHVSLSGVPWDLKDTTLVPKAGACVGCPKSTATSPGLFDDLGRDAKSTCLDGTCFQSKAIAFASRKRDEMKEKNERVVLLSTRYHRPAQMKELPAGTLGTNTVAADHVREGQKKRACTSLAKAVAIDGEEIGKVSEVCTSAKCPVHHYVTPPRSDTEKKREAVAKQNKEIDGEIKARLLAETCVQVTGLDRAPIERLLLDYYDDRGPLADEVADLLPDGFAAVKSSKRPQALAVLKPAELGRVALILLCAQDVAGESWGDMAGVTEAMAKRYGVDVRKVKLVVTTAHRALATKEAPALAAPKAKKKGGRG